jgi:DNA-binding CsgD family transcriptional regulator
MSRPGHNGQPFGLTRQELIVIKLLCEALSNRAIAEKLNITIECAKKHVGNLCDKIGASSRLEAAMFAVAKGLVDVRGNRPGRDDVLEEIEQIHRKIERYVARSRMLVQQLTGENHVDV